MLFLSSSAAALAAPLEGNNKFITAIWNYPDYQDIAYLLTFGTDSGLKPAVGLDDATGLGVTSCADQLRHAATAVSVKP